jgi:hypothetical protein
MDEVLKPSDFELRTKYVKKKFLLTIIELVTLYVCVLVTYML